MCFVQPKVTFSKAQDPSGLSFMWITVMCSQKRTSRSTSPTLILLLHLDYRGGNEAGELLKKMNCHQNNHHKYTACPFISLFLHLELARLLARSEHMVIFTRCERGAEQVSQATRGKVMPERRDIITQPGFLDDYL